MSKANKIDISNDISNIDIFKINTISQVEAKSQLANNSNDILLVDVRTLEEFEENHIENAINIPVQEILYELEETITDKEKKIFLICKSGRRSKIATILAQSKGYTNVFDIGGMQTW